MPSLDNLLAATAAETKKTRPPEETTISLDLNPHGDSANTVELKPDDLTGQLSRIEELLTGDAVKDILESIEELADITREHTDESAQPEVTAWLDDMQELIDDVKSDMRDFASLIRNEFIPAASAMRGEVDSMNTAANKALDTSGALLPGESTGSAAFDTLNKMRTGQMDAQGYGQETAYDPAAQIQRAYATMAALPHAMDELIVRDYTTPRTQTTAGSYAPNYAISTPHPAQSQPMSVPSVGTTHTSAGSMSPLAQAAAATGAIAHGVARGLSGDTPQKRQQQQQAQAAATTQASSGSTKPATSMPLKSGDKPAAPAKGGVSRSELNDMINNAKKRIAAERAGKRKNSPRQLPKRNPRPASTLGGGNAGSKADKDPGKASFLDIASTTPGVARADSGTTAEKPAAAAAAGGGNSGGGGGMRGGMGMMPMGGMMGAMNRAGNGPGGPGKGGEGSGSVEVPTDYNLDEVGKGATSAVAGGVVRPGMSTADEDDSAERIVSPIQRGTGDDEDSKSKKRGLGNIFG